jgi:hypothetical protein
MRMLFTTTPAILALASAMSLAPAHAAAPSEPATAPVAQTSPQPAMAPAMPDAAAQGRAYFRQHSFDFATVFRAQHPGPAWILQHAPDFNLTQAQTTGLEHLRDGMRVAVAKDSINLKQAYTQYAADARAATPQQSIMLKDVQAVGRAQTQLAGAMIPYHLQSYTVLDAAQKNTYERLVAAGG